jgi:hypothetical protein
VRLALAARPARGAVVWDRGQEGTRPCRARTVAATIRFSRTGRPADVREAALHVIELVPLDGTTGPLVLATTLPVATVADLHGGAASTRGAGRARPASNP